MHSEQNPSTNAVLKELFLQTERISSAKRKSDKLDTVLPSNLPKKKKRKSKKDTMSDRRKLISAEEKELAWKADKESKQKKRNGRRGEGAFFESVTGEDEKY